MGFKTSQTHLERAEYQEIESQLRDCCLKLCITCRYCAFPCDMIYS